jgi:hypothetical protein
MMQYCHTLVTLLHNQLFCNKAWWEMSVIIHHVQKVFIFGNTHQKRNRSERKWYRAPKMDVLNFVSVTIRRCLGNGLQDPKVQETRNDFRKSSKVTSLVFLNNVS